MMTTSEKRLLLLLESNMNYFRSTMFSANSGESFHLGELTSMVKHEIYTTEFRYMYCTVRQ